MTEMTDKRREHLIGLMERMAVYQHQLIEVADACRMRGDTPAALLLGAAGSHVVMAMDVIATVIDAGLVPLPDKTEGRSHDAD